MNNNNEVKNNCKLLAPLIYQILYTSELQIYLISLLNKLLNLPNILTSISIIQISTLFNILTNNIDNTIQIINNDKYSEIRTSQHSQPVHMFFRDATNFR